MQAAFCSARGANESRAANIFKMEKSANSSVRYSPYANAHSTRQQARESGSTTPKAEVVIQKTVDQQNTVNTNESELDSVDFI